MSAQSDRQAGALSEQEWRQVVVEVESLRQEYERRIDTAHDDIEERAIGRLWLRLWQAERRRDELLRRSD